MTSSEQKTTSNPRSWLLNEATLKYLNSVSSRESEQARKIREVTKDLPLAVMQIPPEQGQLLAWIIKLLNAKKTLEIGVFTGYSTLWVAQALPEDGKIIACDISKEWTQIGEKYWKEAGVEKKIDLRLAPAAETLEKLIKNGEEKTFDFAFIDADKENIDLYYEQCLKLIRKGGVIAIDNTLWYGRVHDEKVQDKDTIAIRKLNTKLHTDKRVDLAMLPISDGLTLLRVLV